MFYLRFAAGMLGFAGVAGWCCLKALLRRDRSGVPAEFARGLTRWMAPPMGLRVTVRHRERLEAHRPCIFTVNHQSGLDIPVLAHVFGPGSVVIGKKEVTKIPLFGWLFVLTGNPLLDRENRAAAVESLRAVEADIRARRVGVWIAPEGTRGNQPGRLLPFKKGPFVMAVNTSAHVVPVVVSPLRPRSDLPGRRLHPNDVEVRVLEPIAPGDDPEALRDETRRRMQAALSEMAAARGLPPLAGML